MTTDPQDQERRRHIDGFVGSFIDRKKSNRYRSLLLNPERRGEITDDLNHNLRFDLKAKYIVDSPPAYRPNTISYLISDDRELDDRFLEASDALNCFELASWGTIVSIIPGVLAALKEESPSKVQ
jgi:hypothetical protein